MLPIHFRVSKHVCFWMDECRIFSVVKSISSVEISSIMPVLIDAERILEDAKRERRR